MTYLRSIFQLVVLYLTLAGITVAAIPAGWIALKHVPAQDEEQQGYWVLVKEPAEGSMLGGAMTSSPRSSPATRNMYNTLKPTGARKITPQPMPPKLRA